MTDLYPDEEGYISDGHVVAFCKVQAAVEIHEVVWIHGTAVSGALSIAPAAADGDGFAVALKAGAAGEYVPVCFRGVVKLLAGDTITAMDILQNDALGTYVLPIATVTSDEMQVWRGLNWTGTRQRLGVALQAASTSGDEILVLVGKMF